MSTTIQYPYAYDENNNLIHIEGVDRETRREHQYYCPNCGQKMAPRQGEHNVWHFAHCENHNCGEESYIHKMSKLIIAKRFNDSNKPFIIQLSVEPICKKYETCQDYNDNVCQLNHRFEPSLFDLRQYYTLPAQIESEVIDGDIHFRPDVLLKSPDTRRRDIFVEIFYKHKSSEIKLSSTHPVIEIRVYGMEDLKWLEEKTVFSNDDGDVELSGFKPVRLSPNIIGQIVREELNKEYLPIQDCFLPKCLWSASSKRHEYHLRRFTLYRSGKSWNDGIYENELDRHHPAAILDITYDVDKLTSPLNPNVIAAKKYQPYRTCHFCHHCVTWGDTGTTWCKIRKNGSSAKRTFDDKKGTHCRYFEWPRPDLPLDVAYSKDSVEGVDYVVWMNPTVTKI